MFKWIKQPDSILAISLLTQSYNLTVKAEQQAALANDDDVLVENTAWQHPSCQYPNSGLQPNGKGRTTGSAGKGESEEAARDSHILHMVSGDTDNDDDDYRDDIDDDGSLRLAHSSRGFRWPAF